MDWERGVCEGEVLWKVEGGRVIEGIDIRWISDRTSKCCPDQKV